MPTHVTATERWRTYVSTACNVLSTVAVLVLILALRDPNDRYVRLGWHHDLVVLGVRIDTALKYWALMGILCIVKSVECLVHEFGMPVVSFCVYDPDKLDIHGIRKSEVHALANTAYLSSSVRSVFMTVVSVTQVDVALAACVASELVSVYTIGKLLAPKRFYTNTYECV